LGIATGEEDEIKAPLTLPSFERFSFGRCDRKDQNRQMSTAYLGAQIECRWKLIRWLVAEKIISSFAEQLSRRSSQSLQLRGIYDV